MNIRLFRDKYYIKTPKNHWRLNNGHCLTHIFRFWFMVLFQRPSTKPRRTYQPKSLRALCKTIVSQQYTKSSLNACYAEIIWEEVFHEWKRNSTVRHFGPDHPLLPSTWFSVPEFDREHRTFRPKLWDGTHLATRLRCIVCGKGTDGLRKEAWRTVAIEGLNGSYSLVRHSVGRHLELSGVFVYIFWRMFDK